VAEFEGKIVLVTRAASGIGRATAVAFARAGASVVLAGWREGQARETLKLVRCSDRASHITGATLIIDAGFSAR
jgi:NAD(P)-dependent dehydrogenase (short-subunit alcohol dehydrogenase family)